MNLHQEKRLSPKIDSNEIEFPETVYVSDIENRVFQSLVVQAISSLQGVGFLEANLIDNLLRNRGETIKGITVEQDSKNLTVSVRVELNVAFGVSIPEKAQEVQTRITEEITKYTGLHVASVHIVFKNLVSEDLLKGPTALSTPYTAEAAQEDYNDDFAWK